MLDQTVEAPTLVVPDLANQPIIDSIIKKGAVVHTIDQSNQLPPKEKLLQILGQKYQDSDNASKRVLDRVYEYAQLPAITVDISKVDPSHYSSEQLQKVPGYSQEAKNEPDSKRNIWLYLELSQEEQKVYKEINRLKGTVITQFLTGTMILNFDLNQSLLENHLSNLLGLYERNYRNLTDEEKIAFTKNMVASTGQVLKECIQT